MFDATVSDISEGGLRIESAATFPVNAPLDVFVSFPTGKIHLRARVVRTGGEPPTISLAFFQGNPGFARAYEHWVAEVQETTTPSRPTAASGVGRARGPRRKPARDARKGPVKRYLETSGGSAYEVLIEPRGNAWSLEIYPSPRDPHVTMPDLADTFPDYDSAEQALREFLRAN